MLVKPLPVALTGKTVIAATFLACAMQAPAATIFTDAAASDSLISTAGNWDNGLPSAANLGTIAIDANYDSTVNHDGYNVIHTAGTVTRQGGFDAFRLGVNTTWVTDGAAASITSTRGLFVRDGSQFTLQQGNVDLTENTRDTTIWGAGAGLTINGGTMAIGRDLIVRDSAVFTINGGMLTGVDQFLTQSFAPTGGVFNFNGGSTTADNFQLDAAGTAFFGGSTAGSLDLLVGLGNGVTLDWKPGSQMLLTVNGADQAYYEGLYTSGTLLFDGTNASAFADHFTVSGSTVALIPEPGAIVLVGIGGLLMLGRSRHRALSQA